MKNDNEYYDGKGFVYSNEKLSPQKYRSQTYEPIREDLIIQQDRQYLEKIIDYCNKRGIKIVLFSSPMPDFRLVAVGNYDLFIDQIRSIAASKNIRFYDFNLLKENSLDGQKFEFKDDHHLNGEGARVFTKIFSEMFSGKKQVLFWDSYKQKIEDQKYSK